MSTLEDTAPPIIGWVADDSEFGARLALVRQKMGWGNIAKAAKECGVPVDSWRNWEVDGRLPHRITTISMAIATRTNCDYRWLVHGPGRGDKAPDACYDENGTVPKFCYVPGRLVATVGQTAGRRPSTGHATTRPVRQTRPLVGASNRPLAPAVR
jgi:hypothetical protein